MNIISKKVTFIEVWTLALMVANFLALTIGGYFLVGKYEAESHKVDTKIKQLELSLLKANQDLLVSKEQVLFTSDTLKLIGSLRPNFDFKIDEKIEWKNNILTIGFNTKNLTDYRVVVHPKKLWLTEKPVTIPSRIKDANIIATISNFDLFSDVEPNGVQGHRFHVNIPSQHRSKIYYLMCYEVKTDPEMVKVAEKYIKGVTSDSLHNLTTTTQFRYGDINISITNN